jgi:hypothetical protein
MIFHKYIINSSSLIYGKILGLSSSFLWSAVLARKSVFWKNIFSGISKLNYAEKLEEIYNEYQSVTRMREKKFEKG